MANPNSLRILMVTARYFPLMGGIETHVYEVARRMAGQGHQVTVLTTDPHGNLPSQEENEGVRIWRVRAYPTDKDYYFAPGLYRKIKQEKWDIIHFQGVHTLVPLFGMFAALRAKTPYLLSFHTGGHSKDWRNKIRNLQWKILRPLLARATRLVGVSRFEANFFRDYLHLPPDKFRVIQNGGRLPEVPEELPAKADKDTVIVSVGRLERYKGHQRVIAALAKLREKQEDARLLIIGSGPYEAELHQVAEKLGVADYVQIRGIAPGNRQEMASTLSQASLVTLFSDYEAHPIAVMEALALKRPVLVTDTSGLRELAERGLVRAIPLNSTPQEAAEAIVRELHAPLQPPDRIEFPTWEGCTDQLLALYREILRS